MVTSLLFVINIMYIFHFIDGFVIAHAHDAVHSHRLVHDYQFEEYEGGKLSILSKLSSESGHYQHSLQHWFSDRFLVVRQKWFNFKMHYAELVITTYINGDKELFAENYKKELRALLNVVGPQPIDAEEPSTKMDKAVHIVKNTEQKISNTVRRTLEYIASGIANTIYDILVNTVFKKAVIAGWNVAKKQLAEKSNVDFIKYVYIEEHTEKQSKPEDTPNEHKFGNALRKWCRYRAFADAMRVSNIAFVYAMNEIDKMVDEDVDTFLNKDKMEHVVKDELLLQEIKDWLKEKLVNFGRELVVLGKKIALRVFNNAKNAIATGSHIAYDKELFDI